jgi:phosphinothricin acetyltransferase
MATTLRPLRSDEYPALVSFLRDRRLPEAGLSAHVATSIVAEENGQLVGSVAVEPYGHAGLLRSVAVLPAYESQGLGTLLVDAANRLARNHGLSHLYLLTETAPAFFARRGFRAVTRHLVPGGLQLSPEFAGACPASALAMVRAVDDGGDALHGSEGDTRVRPARSSDLASIAEIYNEGVADRIGTFETKPRTPGDVRAWFDGRHPVVVACRGEETVAFAATFEYRPRACYAGISEFSVYVRRRHRGRGFGRAVMGGLLQASTEAGCHKLVSRVFTDNAASRRLLSSIGFREVGTYERHGRLDGVWRDAVIVERLLA